MEIVAFKVKSCILPVLTFGHSDLNILSYGCSFDANSIVLDSWLEDLSVYQILVENELLQERYDFSKMTYEFCGRQVLWRNKSKLHPKASKPTSKSLFKQFRSSKSKFKAWRFYAKLFLFFFRKIVIKLLKCKLST